MIPRFSLTISDVGVVPVPGPLVEDARKVSDECRSRKVVGGVFIGIVLKKSPRPPALYQGLVREIQIDVIERPIVVNE